MMDYPAVLSIPDMEYMRERLRKSLYLDSMIWNLDVIKAYTIEILNFV